MTQVKQIDIHAIFKAQTGHTLTEKQNVKPHPKNTPPKSRRSNH